MRKIKKVISISFFVALFVCNFFFGVSSNNEITLNTANAKWLECTNCKQSTEWCTDLGRYVMRCRPDGSSCDVSAQEVCE